MDDYQSLMGDIQDLNVLIQALADHSRVCSVSGLGACTALLRAAPHRSDFCLYGRNEPVADLLARWAGTTFPVGENSIKRCIFQRYNCSICRNSCQLVPLRLP